MIQIEMAVIGSCARADKERLILKTMPGSAGNFVGGPFVLDVSGAHKGKFQKGDIVVMTLEKGALKVLIAPEAVAWERTMEKTIFNGMTAGLALKANGEASKKRSHPTKLLISKVILASFWSPSLDELAAITWKSKTDYAKRHGYGTVTRPHAANSDILWGNPRKWAQALAEAPDNAIVVITGTDVYITNPDLPMSLWLDDEHDAFVLLDHGHVFGDCHAFRATPKTRELMMDVAERRQPLSKTCGNEQESLAVCLSGMSLDEFTRMSLKGGDFGTQGYYDEAARLLSRLFPVKSINLQGFCGDDPANWWGNIPTHHSWSQDHLMLHLGGLELPLRMAYLKAFQDAFQPSENNP